MIEVAVLFIGLSIHSASTSVEFFKTQVKHCRIGDVTQNECIKCICTSKNVFECLPLQCDKDKIPEQKNATSQQTCLPNQLYEKNLLTCICNKDGKWPHKSCYDTFKSLPPSSVQHTKCEPNTYAVIDCNICRCGPDGEFLSNRCTKNICEDSTYRRTEMEAQFKRSNIYSNCETKNWYSLAPCQFCYCVNENKLICNTGNDEFKKEGLGTYDMQVCGKDLLLEAVELIPNGQKNLKQLLTESKSRTDAETNKNMKNTDSETSNENSNSKYRAKSNGVHKDDTDISQNDSSGQDETTSTTTTTEAPNESTERRKLHLDNPDSSSSEDGDTNEIPLDFSARSKTKNTKITKENRKDFENKSLDLEYNGETFKINLPNMLNKVFEMALRKSMISVVPDTKCVPGSTSKNGCNVCFCLNNGKFVCTSQKC